MRASRVLMVVFALAATVCVFASCDGGGDGGGSSSGGGGTPNPSGIIVYEGAGTSGPVINNGDSASNGRDFGGRDIAAGPTSTLTITIRNSGTGTLALGMPSLTGAGTQFVLGTSSYSTSVAPLTNTSFTIAFDPTTTGAKTATVNITNDAANDISPFKFDVTGVGSNGSLPAITPDIDISGPANPVQESDSSASAVFRVTLSAATSLTVTVDYDTANGTATAGSDYTTTSGTMTFTPGQTTKTVSVTITGDTTIESDEDFSMDLTNAGNGNITTASASATIADDDTPDPTPTYAADIQPIFDARCINCHPSNGGLNLTSYANLMSGTSDNGPVVIAGNANGSLIVKRIEGTITPRMPKNSPALSAQQIQKIKDWINAGAINN